MLRNVLTLVLLPIAFFMSAKDVQVSGAYSFYLPSEMSESEGKETAVQNARIQALANEFGTSVSSEVWMDVREDNEVSSSSLWQLGGTFVKGEWIRDTKQPSIKKEISNGGETIITATVWGIARPITSAGADIDVFLSTPDAGVSQKRFTHGSRFTLSLKSPIAGYVSVYLSDENGDVCRLLPFAMDEVSSVRVNPMEQYEFFTSQHGIEEQYMFQTFESKARNVIYVVFSPNQYIRPLDSFYKERNLRILSRAKFLDWLARQKTADTSLTVITLPVEITAK